jgi:hypothetical protein
LRYSFCNLFAVGRAEEEMEGYSFLLCFAVLKERVACCFSANRKRGGKESLRELSLFLFLLQTEAEKELGFL